MSTVERSARGQIQASLGDAGEVLPRVVTPSRQFPYVGWYAIIHHDHDDGCDLCQAAREDRGAYLGYGRTDSIERIGVYKHTHESAAAA